MTSNFLDIKETLPILGIGLGLRRELAKETLASRKEIDWLEFVPENYMGLGGLARERLEKAAAHFPLVSHGINLSIGSTDELNKDYLKSIKALLDAVNAPWWSDHLCFTSSEGIYMHDLLPLPFSAETINHVATRVKQVQEYVERPFLLENISFYMQMPGSKLTEAEFITEVIEKADCGLLLDVNNVYVNSLNHNFDPFQFLSEIPLSRTVQIHVAGHKQMGDYVIDTHGAPAIEPVYQLLQYTLQHTQVKAVLLERDQNFPAFGELLSELDKIRACAVEVQPSLNVKPPTSSKSLKIGNSGSEDKYVLSA